MSESQPFSGVLVPVLTPYDDDLAPDTARFVAHSQALLEEGADGLAIFGTTSEGNALSLGEKLALLEELVGSGVAAARLMPGTGCCALSDTVELTSRAVRLGCGGVLLLPPFYYKAVDDDGLFAYTAEVIERVGDPRLKVYLYHIPPVAQVGWSLPLIERLAAAYPETVVGIKDSSGDWSNTQAVLEALPGFGTFVGSEALLLDNMKGGGVGCITATANVAVATIRAVYEAWRSEKGQSQEGQRLNDEMVALRRTIQSYPMIPALKEIMAQRNGDPAWRRIRPPLAALSPEQAAGLTRDLARLAFPLAAE